MNRKHLNQIFEAYINKFQYLNEDPQSEYYKWIVIQEFQQVFDIDAADFHAMLKSAKAVTQNLIDSYNQPFAGLVKFADKEPETVRSMFRALFADDHGDLNVRMRKINIFLQDCEHLREKYFPDSHLYKNDLRSVMGYLFFHDPDHHYLYKATEATYFADCVGFYDDWGSMSAFKIDIWYRFCDELIKEIKRTPEIIDTHASRYDNCTKILHSDQSLHILLFDIIYCSYTYNLYSGLNIEKITSASRKLYLENKKKAQALLADVEKAEQNVALLSEAYKYFTHIIREKPAISHKSLGELDVLKLEYEKRTGALMIQVQVKKNNDIKTFQLLSAIANGLITVAAADFTEKVALYNPIMLQEIKIPQLLATANQRLLPYTEYLD